MTPRPARSRSGITLTEILISILIMGIGLISIATLFPIGMVRLRQAQQESRSGLLAESAGNDLGAKNLLYKPSFSESLLYGGFDPFLQDAPIATAISATTLTNTGQPPHSYTGSGLPICYDPLWWAYAGIPAGFTPGPGAAGRFGAGIVSGNTFLRNDPDGLGAPSAHGLQRITNFLPWSTAIASWAYTYPPPGGVAGTTYPYNLHDLLAETFVSPEDVVMQNNLADQQILSPSTNTYTVGTTSSVVPMMFPGALSIPGTQSDWRYTWMFTGKQHDLANGTIFSGDVVVMDSRPLAIDTVTSPVSGNASSVPSGEIVLEAIFGYGTQFPTATVGYAASADRVVLLRWPNSVPDPDIRTGSWFADVTYERFQSTSDTRAGYAAGLPPAAPIYPMQRCHWYQVAKKGDIQASAAVANYRELVVYTTTPLRSRTLLHNSPAVPVYLNVAVFMPSVVNVFPRTVYIR
jgi:type II secretory pathway pseudopilin PulG